MESRPSRRGVSRNAVRDLLAASADARRPSRRGVSRNQEDQQHLAACQCRPSRRGVSRNSFLAVSCSLPVIVAPPAGA